jgi:hypothetical protein
MRLNAPCSFSISTVSMMHSAQKSNTQACLTWSARCQLFSKSDLWRYACFCFVAFLDVLIMQQQCCSTWRVIRQYFVVAHPCVANPRLNLRYRVKLSWQPHSLPNKFQAQEASMILPDNYEELETVSCLQFCRQWLSNSVISPAKRRLLRIHTTRATNAVTV